MTWLCSSLSWQDLYVLLCVARLNNDTLLVQWLEEVGRVRLSKTFSDQGEQSFIFKTFYRDHMERSRVDVGEWLRQRKNEAAKL